METMAGVREADGKEKVFLWNCSSSFESKDNNFFQSEETILQLIEKHW